MYYYGWLTFASALYMIIGTFDGEPVPTWYALVSALNFILYWSIRSFIQQDEQKEKVSFILDNFRRNTPYLNFEREITHGSDTLLYIERDPHRKEMLKQEIRRQRIFARELWEAMGNSSPKEYDFEKTD